MNKTDNRYNLIKSRLEKLDREKIFRIIEAIKENKVCFDTYNYDKTNKTYCPLAIAYRLDELIENPNNEKITNALSKYFEPVNILKDQLGDFYTKNRKEDLLKLCEEILESKKSDLFDRILGYEHEYLADLFYRLLREYSDDDTRIKDSARLVLENEEIDGDSYGVYDITMIVDKLVKKIINLEEKIQEIKDRDWHDGVERDLNT